MLLKCGVGEGVDTAPHISTPTRSLGTTDFRFWRKPKLQELPVLEKRCVFKEIGTRITLVAPTQFCHQYVLPRRGSWEPVTGLSICIQVFVDNLCSYSRSTQVLCSDCFNSVYSQSLSDFHPLSRQPGQQCVAFHGHRDGLLTPALTPTCSFL